MLDIVGYVLWTLLIVLGIAIIALVLLHRGRGGGVSDMFGGGIASGIQSTGSGEKTLTRITWTVSAVWATVIVLLGLLNRFSA